MTIMESWKQGNLVWSPHQKNQQKAISEFLLLLTLDLWSLLLPDMQWSSNLGLLSCFWDSPPFFIEKGMCHMILPAFTIYLRSVLSIASCASLRRFCIWRLESFASQSLYPRFNNRNNILEQIPDKQRDSTVMTLCQREEDNDVCSYSKQKRKRGVMTTSLVLQVVQK